MTSDELVEDPQDKIRATRLLFISARDAFINFVNDLTISDDPEAHMRGYLGVQKSLRTAAQQAIEAEEQIAEFGSKIQTIGRGQLDLDTARREVMDRLARLAAAECD